MNPGQVLLRRHLFLVATLVLAAAACGRGSASSPVPETCSFAADAPRGATRAAAIVVGVAGTVDPAHAPVPRTAAERAVFAHFYETLVRATCDGRTEPLLAQSWRTEDEGRTWTFRLRPDLRDWTGEPVTAADVVAAWSAHAPDAAWPHRAAWPGAMPGWVRLSASESYTVVAELAAPVTIDHFARPELAVVTHHFASVWPAGTGPYRPADNAMKAGATRRLSALPLRGAAALEFRTLDGDARNALDTGVDVLVTDDPAVIAYAASAGSFETLPLGWDRSYVLALPRAAHDPAIHEVFHVRFFPGLSSGLAHDAVRGDARAPEVPLPDATTCAVTASTADVARRGATVTAAAGGRAEARVVYAQDDATARALAERMVALTLPGAGRGAAELRATVPELARGGPARAVGLAAPEFARSLHSGDAAAYVLAGAGTASNDGCGALATLLRQAPWLAAAPQDNETRAIVPLIETRRTLVLRRGIRGVELDGAGRLLLHRAAPPPRDGGAR